MKVSLASFLGFLYRCQEASWPVPPSSLAENSYCRADTLSSSCLSVCPSACPQNQVAGRTPSLLEEASLLRVVFIRKHVSRYQVIINISVLDSNSQGPDASPASPPSGSTGRSLGWLCFVLPSAGGSRPSSESCVKVK